jgi:hypothetical protein
MSQGRCRFRPSHCRDLAVAVVVVVVGVGGIMASFSFCALRQEAPHFGEERAVTAALLLSCYHLLLSPPLFSLFSLFSLLLNAPLSFSLNYLPSLLFLLLSYCPTPTLSISYSLLHLLAYLPAPPASALTPVCLI